MPKQAQRKTGVELCRNCGRRNFLVESSGKEEENPWPRSCVDSGHARLNSFGSIATESSENPQPVYRAKTYNTSSNSQNGHCPVTRKQCVFTTARDYCGKRNCTCPSYSAGRGRKSRSGREN